MCRTSPIACLTWYSNMVHTAALLYFLLSEVALSIVCVPVPNVLNVSFVSTVDGVTCPVHRLCRVVHAAHSGGHGDATLASPQGIAQQYVSSSDLAIPSLGALDFLVVIMQQQNVLSVLYAFYLA